MDGSWCFVLAFVISTVLAKKAEIEFRYNNTYKYNVLYTVQVNKHIEYIMEFAGDLEAYDTPARVTVASDLANKTFPLFVTARQQKGVFSWQLPMIVQTPNSVEQFTNISRTLCPHNIQYIEDEESCDVSSLNTPIVHLTSASPVNITVVIMVETVQDFFIKLNTTTNLTSSPSQPKYYFFPFNQSNDTKMQILKHKSMCNEDLSPIERFNLNMVEANAFAAYSGSFGWFSRPKSVILMIESDDDICAVISIQNYSCPVFDTERDIAYDGYYLTMTRRGGITLTQETFPQGFYIVLIVKSDDAACTDGVSSGNATDVDPARTKNFRFRVVASISYVEYAMAAGAALGFFLSFYAVLGALGACRGGARAPAADAEVAGDEEVIGEVEQETSQISPIVQEGDSTRRRLAASASTSAETGTSRHHLVEEISSSSDTESDFSTLDDAQFDKDVYRYGGRLCVANLARCRPRVLSARSRLYLWNVLTVAVFYTLPVIQLVVTYQRLLNQSGNQDLCYFNFLCAHPLMVLSDFNHVYSNIGYVLLGVLFTVQVWRRHKAHEALPARQKQLGIPQHFGLVYAMGIALISEGLLSAAYHVCPNSMNFQFDTSFMYVTAVLCMVKIYQSRHPDINARAHATFGVLALIIFIGLVGVLNANLYFWVAFTVLHLSTCLFMTFQIYYLGRFRVDGGVVWRAARQFTHRPLAAMTPTHCGRCVLLIIANAANWAIAAYGVSQHSRDFASHLLLVLMTNLFLYTLFYIAMKLLHREIILWYSWIYIALTYTVWFSSSYFYLDQNTNWALTPAQSRQNNKMCSLLQLYDAHDIWHFMSATAMFFSFNMYLTIDDNLAQVPRENIMVF